MLYGKNMMIKKLLLFLFLLMVSPFVWSAEPIRNLSSIVYEEDSSIKGGLWIFGKCTGTVGSMVNLPEAGISDQELKDGVGCATGDFDGNGYLDFCLYGKRGPKIDASVTQFFKVIYFRENKILGTELLQHPRQAVMSRYIPRDKPGKWGEPVTRTDGLVDWGEGARNIFYVYDKKSSHLKMSEHVSESN